MADLDEGAINAPNAQAADQDLSDEVQDFRFLASLSSATNQSVLPRRGEKDFEPHGTSSQQNVLGASREAMHNALSHPRHHAPKAHIIGSFSRKTGLTTIAVQKGQHFRVMGRANKTGGLYLFPEEALYLLERGTLDVRWEEEDQGMENAEHEEDAEGGANLLGGLPMSLQSAYASMIGTLGLTLEQFNVFSGLRRSGYIVQRADTWYGGSTILAPPGSAMDKKGLLSWIFDSIPTFQKEQPLGPLAGPGLYRSYNDVFQRLAVVPFHNPTSPALYGKGNGTSEEDGYEQRLHVCYNVWKPRPDFRKSAPGVPDFRIAVINARDEGLPDLEQLNGLLLSTPFAPPDPTSQLYQKLKHGWRNVILAIVDTGVVSYTRIADAGFGKQKVYNRPTRGGNKRGRGGRGGGGGQSRGKR